MKKQKSKGIWYIITMLLIVALIAVLIFGGMNGWFKFVVNVPSQTFIQNLTQSPSPETPVYTTCSQVCSANDFDLGYSASTCKDGETRIAYGYAQQAPLLTCCCYNSETPAPSGTCTEADGGNVDTIPATTIGSDGIARMDVCADNTHVTEYWCVADGSGDWQSGTHSCLAGQTCLSSRSGGYCKTKVWNEGDTIIDGGGTGSTTGSQEGFSEIDLGDYGLASGGNCQLGAQISVNWDYGNLKCTGIMGSEGMLWEFYDSAGLEYSRTDTSPTAWTVDLHPRGHILNWDGHTAWRAYAKHTSGQLPECVINYQYNVRVYIYDCL